jgi:hypothetical protein
MHRSGTSAVAGVAVRLGLAGPKTELPASTDNPGGFYESLPVVKINHNILVRAGCAWNLCLGFEPGRWDGGAAERALMAAVLAAEFPDAPFVLKDPRLCLTLPNWLPVLREGGEVRVLIVVRHPVEVVRSLAARNGAAETETAPHWLHHMLEAERSSRGLRRAVLFYDDLMQDWRRCIAAAPVEWPRPEAAGEVDAFLAPAQRHHAAQDAAAMGTTPVAYMLGAAWRMFRQLASDPEDAAALANLDHLRENFAAWRALAVPPGFRAGIPAV